MAVFAIIGVVGLIGGAALSSPSVVSISTSVQTVNVPVSIGGGRFQQAATLGNSLMQGNGLVECKNHIGTPIGGWDRKQKTYIKKIKEFEKRIKTLYAKDDGRLFYYFEHLVKEQLYPYLDRYFNELEVLINNFNKDKYLKFVFKVRIFVEKGVYRN